MRQLNLLCFVRKLIYAYLWQNSLKIVEIFQEINLRSILNFSKQHTNNLNLFEKNSHMFVEIFPEINLSSIKLI